MATTISILRTHSRGSSHDKQGRRINMNRDTEWFCEDGEVLLFLDNLVTNYLGYEEISHFSDSNEGVRAHLCAMDRKVFENEGRVNSCLLESYVGMLRLIDKESVRDKAEALLKYDQARASGNR